MRAAGTQAVAIESGADDAAVTEGDGCRSVPGLGDVHVVAEEGGGVATAGGGRKKHAHGFGDGAAVL